MLDRTRYRMRIKRLYRKAVRAGLTDLGVRMRNETALRLENGETLIEDEPVLVGDAQSLTSKSGSGLGRWGWMVLTSNRLIWAAYPERNRMETELTDLNLIFSEDDRDTFRWIQQKERFGRKPKETAVSVTLGFLENSDIRSVLHGSVNNGRHDSEATTG